METRRLGPREGADEGEMQEKAQSLTHAGLLKRVTEMESQAGEAREKRRSGGDWGDLCLQETESVKTHLGDEAKKRDQCVLGRKGRGL